MSYNSWMPNKLGCRIMVIGSTPPVFLCFSQLPLYKIWGGTSFFVSSKPYGTRAKNYEIHSIEKDKEYFSLYSKKRDNPWFLEHIEYSVAGKG